MTQPHPRQRKSPLSAPGSKGKVERERRLKYQAEFQDFDFEDPMLQEVLEKIVAMLRQREGTGKDPRGAFVTRDELEAAGVIAVIDGIVTKSPSET